MATGGEASWGSEPFAAAPRPEPMDVALSRKNSGNVASLRSPFQPPFSCFISDSSLKVTAERRFAPTTVRYESAGCPIWIGLGVRFRRNTHPASRDRNGRLTGVPGSS